MPSKLSSVALKRASGSAWKRLWSSTPAATSGCAICSSKSQPPPTMATDSPSTCRNMLSRLKSPAVFCVVCPCLSSIPDPAHSRFELLQNRSRNHYTKPRKPPDRNSSINLNVSVKVYDTIIHHRAHGGHQR